MRFSQAMPTLRLWMPPTKVNKTHSTSSATPLYMVLLLTTFLGLNMIIFTKTGSGQA